MNPAQAQKAGDIIPGQYIIKLKSVGSAKAAGAQGHQKLLVSKAQGILGKAAANRFAVRKMFGSSNMLQIDSDTANDADLQRLRADSEIEFVEPNRVLALDPVTIEQMGVAPNSNDSYSQSYSNVQLEDAWALAKAYNNGPKAVIAVIDTGLDLDHGLIRDSGSIWENAAEKNGVAGIDDDGNGYIDDVNGWNFVDRNATMYDDGDHGTHVAGIVIGTGFDVLAMPVRESRHLIMPLKFLSGTGSGTTSDAISAMYYAVNNGAKIINNSWGGPTYSQALHEAYTYAYNNGVVVVTAAGNSAAHLDQAPMYPAAFDTPSNITVIATSDSDNRASFSNYSTSLSHVGAPGVSIISAVPGQGCSAPGCFAMMSGTSMAAPFVAGLAGLILREATQLSAYQVRGIVLSSVDSVAILSSRTQTSGRVNALKAVQSAKSNATTQSWSPSYSPSYKIDSRSVASESAAPASGCGLVKAVGGFGDSGPMGPGGLFNIGLIFVVMMVPLLTAMLMRRKKSTLVDSPANRRQYERFAVVREIAIKVGDHVIQAASQSLSIGGLSFSDQTKFEMGQKIKVQLDKNGDEVDAEIVWCSKSNSYGVKFTEVTETLRTRIKVLTYGAAPA